MFIMVLASSTRQTKKLESRSSANEMEEKSWERSIEADVKKEKNL